MDASSELAAVFELHRRHLCAVAQRILGTHGDAEDAVQEAWLRLARHDAATLDNLGGWLTTVVSRICLDMLRSRRSRREDPLHEDRPEPVSGDPWHDDPARQTLLADAIGPALQTVLDTLAPVERLAFVLHDLFGLSFDEIAPIVERTPVAARQLASRARRRVRGAEPEPDRSRQRAVVDAFLAASREGDFATLLKLLDPDVVLRVDAAAVAVSTARLAQGAPPLQPELRGAEAVAETFRGRAREARLVLLDGLPGAVWAPGGELRAAFAFRIERDRIAGIEIVADPATLRGLAVQAAD